ncbi:MAG: hypothetical protein NT029_11745 [Armatimonadetes bacterium]|nr:hypothetical protein [Armatimonadota bacterium]
MSSEPRDDGPSRHTGRGWIIHPVIAAVYPILALYARNLGQITPPELLRPIGVTLAATCAVWLIVGLLSRDAHKGATVASCAVLVFFSYGHARNLAPPGLHGWIVPLFAIGMAALVAGVWRRKGSMSTLTSALNVASIALVAPSCWAIAAGARPMRPGPPRRAQAIPTVPMGRVRPIPSAVAAVKPDVYYIVLDAYGRADALRAYYGYDNEPFLRELEKRGFTITRESRANYEQTPLCLASVVNLEYLDGLAKRMGPAATDMEPLRAMIDRNRVADEFRAAGLKYIYIWTGAGQSRVETADLMLDSDTGVSSFEGQVLGLSALDVATNASVGGFRRHRDMVLAAFKHLGTVAKLPYRKFVFAHIMAPHPPFTFMPDGAEVKTDRGYSADDGSRLLQGISREQYRRGYIDQLQYINKRTLEAIDQIIRQSRRPPVIIVQGDHGSRMNLDWESLELTDVQEPYSILNAYRAPEAVRKYLYPSISPVNTFRLVLTRLFGAHYPLLPDRSYYSTANAPYGLTDVTGLLQAGKMPAPPGR